MRPVWISRQVFHNDSGLAPATDAGTGGSGFFPSRAITPLA